MNRANRAFYGLLALAVLVATGLGAATLRLMVPHVVDAGSRTDSVVRWCLHLVTGSPDTDELLLAALLGILPVAVLLAVGSLVRQWWATRLLLPVRGASQPQVQLKRVVRLAEHLRLANRVDVVRAEQPYAYCYGLLRPRICLSIGLVHLLGDEELEAVLLHERYHLQNHDPLKIVLARTLGRAFFFLPVIGELGRCYALTRELTADRAVIGAQGHGRWLAAVLYKLITRGSPTEEGPVAIVGFTTVTDLRIDHLLDGQETASLRLSSSAVLISAFVLLAVASVVLSPGFFGVGDHVYGLAHATVCPL